MKIVEQEKIETVILVHGTFSNPKDCPGEITHGWWRAAPGEESLFQNKLNEFLEKNNSDARCWAHLSCGYKEFEWSGKNSEFERRESSIAFREYLVKLEEDRRIKKYHIVAHSHGGYLTSRTLLELAMGFSHSKLGTVVLLGTPFFYSWTDKFVTGFLIPKKKELLGISLLLSVGSIYLWTQRFYISAIIYTLFLFVSFMFTITGYRFNRVNPPKCKLAAITSKYDEALLLLKNALETRKKMGLGYFLKKYFSHLPDIAMPEGFLWSHTSAFRNLTWRSPTLLIKENLKKVFGHTSILTKVVAAVSAVVILGLLPFTVPIIVADWLFGLPTTLSRYIIVPFYKAMLHTLTIRFSVKLILGEDLFYDRVNSVNDKPRELEEIYSKEPILEELEEELRKKSIIDIASKLHQIYNYGASTQIDPEHIVKTFTNTSLVHAQYTKNDKIIQIIAKAISNHSHPNGDMVEDA